MTTTTQTVPARLAGRCFNGAERDSGRVYHAVAAASAFGRALCGAQPGLRSNGWVHAPEGAVTCPRCLKAAK